MAVDGSPLSVLRSPAWSTLVRRLDAVATRDTRLAMARDALVRPVELLETMAARAPGALGESMLEAEELRMLVYLASPLAGLVDEARKLAEATARRLSPALPYEPGIIDHGALVIVAVAAVRVAPPSLGMRTLFRDTVHGLALAAGPIEVLGRLDPRAPDPETLTVVLKTFHILDAVGDLLHLPLLRPFSDDPVERGRWQCLAALLGDEFFNPILKEADLFEGAHVGGIEQVSRPWAAPGETVVLTGKVPLPGTPGVRVVFASAERPPEPASIVEHPGAGARPGLAVRVPPEASPGWIGFSDDALIAESNDWRRRLRRRLEGVRDPVCLGGSTIPAHHISQIGTADPGRPGKQLAVPPRSGANRFYGGTPARAPARIVAVCPTVLDPETFAPLALPWTTTRDTIVRAGETVGLRLDVLPLPWVDDGLAVLVGQIAGGGDPRVPTLLERLARSAMLTRDAEDALWVLLLPEAEAGPVLRAVQVARPPAPANDFSTWLPAPAARAVAVTSVGALPDLLAAVFPPDAPVRRPSDGVRRLRLLGRLHSIPASHSAVEHGPVRPRVRLVPRTDGVLDVESLEERLFAELEPARDETRAAGPGAPFETGVLAVALDRVGRELVRVPVTVLRDAPEGDIGLLLPVSAEMVAVELRRNGRAIGRVERTDGSPHLEASLAAGRALSWTYRHDRNVRGRFTLAVRANGLTTTVSAFDSCDRAAVVPLSRFAAPEALVLAASDGWNAVEAVSALDPEDGAEGPVVIRRVGDVGLWADVPPAWSLAWSIDGRPAGAERVLPASVLRGTRRVVLEATPPESTTAVRDEVELGVR